MPAVLAGILFSFKPALFLLALLYQLALTNRTEKPLYDFHFWELLTRQTGLE